MDNQAQVEFWNGGAGDQWVQAQAQMDAMLAPLSDATLERAAVQSGERVIDVGCGCGGTSIALAAGGGAVWGVDISAPMLAVARQRAEGLAHVAFSEADAATQAYTPDHDLVFSRFGVMFFADSEAAFANLRTSLKPSGRLVFVCWQAPRLNAWMSVVGKAVQPLLPEVGPPADPYAPGPFAFADSERLRGILSAAGYVDIEIESLDRPMHLGDSIEEALAFQAKVGPLARGLAELNETTRTKALAVAAEALAPYQSAQGIQLGAACWLVEARNPAS